jgi:hypothetical protein
MSGNAPYRDLPRAISARVVVFLKRPVAPCSQIKENVGWIPINRTLLLATSIVGIGSYIDANHWFSVRWTDGRSVDQGWLLYVIVLT